MACSLEMKPLVDLTSKALARMIEGKSPEEIRTTFNLPDDLTEEEKLEPLKSGLADARIKLLNKLYAKKRQVCCSTWLTALLPKVQGRVHSSCVRSWHASVCQDSAGERIWARWHSTAQLDAHILFHDNVSRPLNLDRSSQSIENAACRTWR